MRKYGDIKNSLEYQLRMFYDYFGMMDYDLELFRLLDRPGIAVRLTRILDEREIMRYEDIGRVLSNWFSPMTYSRRHEELINENDNLKKLLQVDETEGLNLNWE